MQLLEYFKELTIHPKNAKELKGLILQLAIQGKLTKKWRDEHPNVEPALVFLEKIKAEKAQLIKEKTIRKENLDLVEMDKVYFEIPDSWVWERIGNIGFVFNGDSINKSLKESKYEGLSDGYPYIATKDVGYINDPINYENGVKIPFNETQFKIAEKGSVLICSEGGSAGKKMGIVEEDVCFGNKLYAIKQFANIYPTYIQAVYGSKSFQNAFKASMTGIIGGISRNNFASLYFPLPPLEEQKAIVELVEQLFKELEQLEAQTKLRIQLKEDYVSSALRTLSSQATELAWVSLMPHLKEFFTEKSAVKKLRESVLQLAVQGKLTKKWRAENTDLEPASVLLEKIKAEKEQLITDKKIKKEKPLPPIAEEEIPYELPESWEWVRFGDIITEIEAGKSPRCNPEAADFEQWGVIKMSAISWGNFNPHENKRLPFENEAFFDKEIKAGDFIMTRANTSELIARSVIVPEGVRQKLLLNDKTLRVKFSEIICSDFANSYNNSTYARKHYVKVSTGTSNSMQNISRENIKLLIFPLTSTREQKAIVEKVNTLMAFCDQLEAAIEKSTIQMEQLMQSCLKEVFEG
jgi:type I restriction enzyme S subunit